MEVDNPQNTNNQKLYYEPNPNDPKNPRRLIDTYDINTVYSIVASRYAKYESTFIPLKQYTYSYYAGQPEDLSAEATHISYFFNKVKN
jgi:hypothetical protein